jgi:hypothetical protein
MMNEEINQFIEALGDSWQRPICAELRDVVHAAIPDVQERIQYKKPHFLKNGKYAAVISTSKAAVSFTIFNAAEIDVPEGFDGPPERKTIKLQQGHAVDSGLLTSLLRQAASTL